MIEEGQASDGYRAAFESLLRRVQQHLAEIPAEALPIRMYIAGGAALHLYTGSRVTMDVDAIFSRRVLFADDLSVSWRDTDGRARALYLDRNYNDTLGLMHEEAYDDALPVAIAGIDPSILQIYALSPLDLAVSKIARFSEQDRGDIETLARAGLIDTEAFRMRATEAVAGYVGDLRGVTLSIELVCKLVTDLNAPR
jgi:hypothetical protein